MFAYATIKVNDIVIKIFVQPDFVNGGWVLVDEDENILCDTQKNKEDLLDQVYSLFNGLNLIKYNKEGEVID